jgi:hypothetical protein
MANEFKIKNGAIVSGSITGITEPSAENSTKMASTAWVRTYLTENSGAAIRSVQSFTATANQTSFTISGGYTVGLVDVYLNGAYLNTASYTASNGTTVVLTDAASVDDILDVVIYKSFSGFVTSADQIAEGSTNLYYTNARARASLSFAAGSGAYNSSTGVITIPTNTSQLTNGANYITRTGLTASSPLLYNNSTGVFSIQQASGSQSGFISSTDWNTFNNKVSAATLNNYVTLSTAQTINATKTFSVSTVSDGILINNTSGRGIRINNTSTGFGLIINNEATATATSITIQKSGSVVLTINDSGNVTANSFIKSGGTSSQFLKANGSIDSNSYALTSSISGTTNYLAKFTAPGTVGTSQIFDNGTNVGVGTTNPNAKLQISGQDLYLTGYTDNRIRFSNFGFTGNNMGAAIGYVYNVANTQESGSLAFYTNPNFNGTGSLAERMRITSGGNVLIGTTTDNGARLRSSGGSVHFEGNGAFATFNSTNSNQFKMILQDSGTTRGFLGADATNAFVIGSTSASAIVTISNSGASTFSSSVALNGTITNNGTGIDTYTRTVWYVDTNNQILFENGRVSDSSSGTGRTVYFTWRGGPSVGGGVQLQHGTNAWAAYTSDARLKTKVADIENGIDAIMKLNPIKFKWSRELENSRIVTGFTAQNVEEAIPDAVFNSWHDNEIGDVKSYYQDYLIPYLVKAIQELNEKLK